MQPEILLPPYDQKMVSEEVRDEEIEDTPGASETGSTEIDPVTFSVFLSRIEGIMGEMHATIVSTARNPILYGCQDFTCSMLNPKAKLVWIYDCLPCHVGTLSPALRWVVRVFKGDIREGDVFVNNAAYAGNAHVGDWTMFAPVFYEGKLVVWMVIKCHLIDNGAHVPTNLDPHAKDVYEEGIHFPGVRLCRDHKMIPDIVRLIAYNHRYSKNWYGDFLAQLGALWVAENSTLSLCKHFGYDTVKGCFEECLRYGDRVMTEEIRKLPKVTVEEEMISEKFEGYCPDGVKLKMKLSVDPDKALINFDYREMPDQLPWGYNLTYGTSLVTAMEGTLATLGAGIPRNDGAIDHIKVLQREGSMVGIPEWPVGTSCATIGYCDETANLVLKTWAKVLPEKALAGMGEISGTTATCSGIDRRTNEPYGHLFFIIASPAGATQGYDGRDHIFGPCVMGVMAYEFIETVEIAVPVIIWGTGVVTDSGGAGKWRGGIAQSHLLQPRDHDMRILAAGIGHTSETFGLFGGSTGTVSDHWIVDQAGNVVKHLMNDADDICKANEEWRAVTAAGGGFGDPLERDPEAVRDDVRDDFVSLKAARDIYGVVINTEPELYEVDYPATEKLRVEAKKKKGKE